MASRYYVDTILFGAWDGTALLEWATTSGGAGGQAEPTTSDNVFFDGNSNGGTVSVTTTTAQCADLTFTGYTSTFAGSTAMQCNGSLTFSTGMTNNYTGTITLGATTSGKTITSNGKMSGSALTFNGVNGVWTFQDACASTTLTVTKGSIVTNDQTITLSALSSANTNTRAITLGASTIILTGSSTSWNTTTTTGLVFDAGTSTIKLTNNSSSSKTFAGGGLTYYNFWNATQGSGVCIISGSNTFNNFRSDAGRTIQFASSITTTIASLSVDGTAGNLTVLQDNAGQTYNLVSTGAAITMNYVNIKNCHASGATFTANNSIDGGGNTGITFTSSGNNTGKGLSSTEAVNPAYVLGRGLVGSL